MVRRPVGVTELAPAQVAQRRASLGVRVRERRLHAMRRPGGRVRDVEREARLIHLEKHGEGV